jgi:hypothetical protein
MEPATPKTGSAQKSFQGQERRKTARAAPFSILCAALKGRRGFSRRFGSRPATGPVVLQLSELFEDHAAHDFTVCRDVWRRFPALAAAGACFAGRLELHPVQRFPGLAILSDISSCHVHHLLTKM